MDYEQILTESIIFFSFGGGILRKYISVFIYTSASSLELTDVYIYNVFILAVTQYPIQLEVQKKK